MSEGTIHPLKHPVTVTLKSSAGEREETISFLTLRRMKAKDMRLADKIGGVILERCWNDKRKAFTAAADTDDMDASVLLLPELGLIDSADPRFVSTVAAIEQDLVRGHHVLRYCAADDFGLPESEFLVCRFWLIDALCLLGRSDEARDQARQVTMRVTA